MRICGRKNANWLIDNRGKLRIADTKSFLVSDAREVINLTHHRNR